MIVCPKIKITHINIACNQVIMRISKSLQSDSKPKDIISNYYIVSYL